MGKKKFNCISCKTSGDHDRLDHLIISPIHGLCMTELSGCLTVLSLNIKPNTLLCHVTSCAFYNLVSYVVRVIVVVLLNLDRQNQSSSASGYLFWDKTFSCLTAKAK